MSQQDEDLDLSDWEDVSGAEEEIEAPEIELKPSKNEEDEEEDDWNDVIAIEVLENYSEPLMKELENYRQQGLLCDAIIAVDDRELPVHKNIVSAMSPFFRDIFAKLHDPTDNKITLHNLNGAIMNDILHFIYTGEVSIHDGNVRQMLAASRFLKLESLKGMAISYLKKKLSPGNVIDILLLADKHKCQSLLEQAEKLVVDNFVLVSKTQGFKKLKFEMIHLFLQSEFVRVSKEEEVFEALMSWIKSDFGDKREKMSHFPLLLREIRFPLISPSYMTEVSMDSIILENSECYDIVSDGLKYHSSKEHQELFEMRLRKPRKFMETVKSVLAVGGWDGDKPVKQVLAFVDSKQNWFPLKPMPSARYAHSVVACNGYVYVLGGRDSNSKLLSSVIRFDPTTNVWQNMKPLPYLVASSAVCTFEGQIFVVGGISINGSIDSVLRFSARYNVWQKVGSLRCARGACALVVDDKFMYAIGGLRKSVSNNGVRWEYLDSMEIYSRDTNTWRMGKSLLSPRAYGTAACLNKKIFLAGGQSKLMVVNKAFEIYDFGKDEWVSISYNGLPRSLNGITVNDGRIYYVGGQSKDSELTNNVEMYDVGKSRSTKIPALPMSLGLLQCCTLSMKLAVLHEMDLKPVE